MGVDRFLGETAMARLSDETVTRIKQEVSLQSLVEGMGITLKRHGSDLVGLCPFHDDKEPSLVISPEKNLWHCLGACQTGGSVIDWVMKAEGVSFRHAVELLLADYAPSLVADAVPVKRTTVQKLPTPLSNNAEDQALLQQVVDYYHETLKNDAEGLAYLEKRGLNREALEHFKLGLANRTLGYRLPEKTRKTGAEIRGRLQTLGILRNSGHEHFNGSLVIPVIHGGQITEIYGRKLNDRLRKGTPMHLYLPGPHQGVFNLKALSATKEIILCESLIDALTFWCAGFKNVTASYGIEGFTADHLKAFKERSTERVLIAYDRDAAGEAAAEKLAKQLMAEGVDCYRIHFPKGMDANEYACQVKPASKSLGVVIRSAVWLGKGQAPLKPESQVASQVDEAQESFEPLPAKVIPDLPKSDILAEVKEDEVVIILGDRRYRIRGLNKNLSANQLKVNLLVNREAALHVDTFDLYAAKARGLRRHPP
jgi:DNA primase catalytic core